jgi:hypothetical protein
VRHLLEILIRKIADGPLVILHLHVLERLDRPGLFHTRQTVDHCAAQHNICKSCAFLEHGVSFSGIIRHGFSGSAAQFFIALEQCPGYSFKGFFCSDRDQCKTHGTSYCADRGLHDLFERIDRLDVAHGATSQRSQRQQLERS